MSEAPREYETLEYEIPTPGVARILLDRPETRNAQDKRMTYELNAAFDRVAADDDVAVAILGATGPHFSSGHDLRDRTPMSEFAPVSNWGGFARPAAEGWMAAEEEIYLQMCWRWRNLPKPTIAQVQGKAIAGALMLTWVCDLIVAADDALFSDPTVSFGVNGVEYFAHPWELGPRKAKEMLFTGQAFTAEECRALGMVNHVVAREDLESFTLALAERVAARPQMGLKLAKQSVNQAVDAQGFWSALQSAMSLQQLGHSNNQQVHGLPIDPAGLGASKAPKQARTSEVAEGRDLSA
ncbi:MAG: enoyl-CoA hydratase [Acidimicrobiia bacterium]